MRYFLIMMSFVMMFSFFTGCSKKSENDDANNAQSTSTNSIGVAACDEYLTKYEKCIGNVPEAVQGTLRQSLDQTRQQWKVAVASVEAKVALDASCKAALDAAAQSMQAYGCEW